MPTIADDPQRPRFHLAAPANWMNDPNGLIHWRGRYHAFYQHNPSGPLWGDIHWGHAVSPDLVRWEHLPVALAPTSGGPDADGCWSGCAVDDDGTATIIYTGYSAAGGELPCLATSADDDLATWRKYPGNPVIAAPPAGLDLVGFRDHCVWRRGDEWRMVIGSGIRDVGGAALLYASPDLRHWRYLHPLCVGDHAPIDHLGTMWECPDFFPLGDRHVLIISQIPDGAVYAMVGDYDGERFMLEYVKRLDAHTAFYAPQSFRDARGRRIMLGWLREQRPDAALTSAGWAGMLSLPRILAIDDGGFLRQRPLDELATLRGAHTAIPPQPLAAVPTTLATGLHLEMRLNIQPGAAPLTLTVSDGDTLATMVYEPATYTLVAIPAGASPEQGQRIRHVTDSDDSLRLRVFVDGSVLEIFSGDHACLTLRFYPQRPDSVRIAAASETAHIVKGEWWETA